MLANELRKHIYLLTIFVLCLAVTSQAEYLGSSAGQAKPRVVPGVLEVQFTSDVVLAGARTSFGRLSLGQSALDAVFDRHQVSDIVAIFPWRSETSQHSEDRTMSRFQKLSVPIDADLDLLISELMASGKVLTAERSWDVPVAALTPDDPRFGFSGQYGLTLTGATSVWEVETGSDTAKIAIADTGVNYRHEDLRKMIWVNPGEDLNGNGVFDWPADSNGIDDDGNGYIDDVIGWDFVNGVSSFAHSSEDAEDQDNNPMDFDGHGTHVSGIASAATDNSVGVASISFGITIMPLRVGIRTPDGGGLVFMSFVAEAYVYAADNGASVTNLSAGNSGSILTAARYAFDNGVVIVQSAGNGDNEIPAALGTVPWAISVAAVIENDKKTWYSTYGNWVTVSAPGGDGLFNGQGILS
ncbi:MAG: S8 family serine peptidase, partial [candidate division Zixibacteria bacterium]|nr:S8 family serine peptidase [candidate division Zixibacteria bacterium]